MTRRERVEQWADSTFPGDSHLGCKYGDISVELRALWAILDTVNAYDKGGTKDGYDAIWAAISEYNNELGGGK